MASGRVEAEPAILKTLQSPQIRGGFTLPLPLPLLRLGQLEVPLEKILPSENVKKPLFLQRFRTWAPQGPPKDPPRTPKDPSWSSQGRPRAPQGPSKQPPRLQNELQGSPKNLQMLKTLEKPMVFQCFYNPPNCFISSTQASPGTQKSSPSTS